MFKLAKQAVTVVHLNIREEIHGEDKVLAEDVKLNADMPNDFLSQLSTTLKWSLYDKPDGTQGELITDAGHMPRLRYSQLGILVWKASPAKMLFTIHGDKKAHDMVFEAVVGKVVLDCKDGGTVSVTFSAAVYPTAEESGRLAALLGQEQKVSVQPVSEKEPESGGDES